MRLLALLVAYRVRHHLGSDDRWILCGRYTTGNGAVEQRQRRAS